MSDDNQFHDFDGFAILRKFLRAIEQLLKDAAKAVHERQFELQGEINELGKTRDRLDGSIKEIHEIIKSPQLLEQHLGEEGVRLGQAVAKRRKARESRNGQVRAMACAGRLEFRWLEGGNCQVEIDVSTVVLPDKLAKLLEILSAEEVSPEKDGMPAFKSRKLVLDEMIGQTASPGLTLDNLNNLVWRLRKRLQEAGLSCGLVETSRGRGLRFRLKRPGSDRDPGMRTITV